MGSLSSFTRYLEGKLSLLLVVLCGAIATALVVPLGWLVIEATTIDTNRAIELLFRDQTRQILVNSLLLMTSVTALCVLLGVPLAYLTVRTNLPFRRFWSVMLALPLVVPSYVGAFAFVSAFGPRGEFHSLLSPLGIDRIPEIYGLPGTVLVISLYTYPYVYLTTRASLISFDTRLTDAARTLNQSRFASFRRVTLPQIRPGIAAGALLAALYAVSDFGTPAIMQYPVFTWQIYVENRLFNRNYAALLSLQLLVIVLAVLVIEWYVRPGETSGGSEGAETDRQRHRLGAWRWPVTLFPAAVTTVGLAIPIWILVTWWQRADAGGYRAGELAFEWGYAFNTVVVAVAAAVVAALVALPIAYYAASTDSPLATIFERVTYIGFAVPGIVLALAFVAFGTGFLTNLYQTIPFLISAYVVRFVPQAVGSARTSILQVDQQLVEAGRTLGESSLGAFRRITLPLVRPGIVVGAALVFLTTMKELPVTLVLRPSGFETFATQIWRAQDAAVYQYAAIPAILLLFISGISMLILLSQERGAKGL
jgi:iron(III) transport system permease protein